MEELIKSWDKILKIFKEEYDIQDISFNTFIKPLEIYSVEDNIITLLVSKGRMGVSLIEKKYREFLEITVCEVMDDKYTIRLISDEDIEHEEKIKKEKIKAAPPKSDDSNSNNLSLNLNPNYTFDTFVVGNNNSLAHAASVAVAESPGEVYNPLFIYGGVGLGKTHLMQAIAHFIIENNPNKKVLYVTSETFTNELIDAIRNKENAEKGNAAFRNRYRNIDVLLIDDIQFIAGKDATEMEFFNVFNDLRDADKQIIITSDKPPKDIPILEERLRTRFGWGLITDIQPPDFETRLAILRRKVTQENLDVSDEVLGLVAERVYSNIRDLEGSLNRVLAYAKFINKPITASLAENVLKDYVSGSKQRTVTPELIRRVVCDFYSVSPAEMEAGRRERRIAYPRQIAMYLTRILTESSFPEIGAFYGGRHYSTVMYACEQIEKSIETDAKLKKTVDDLTEKIMNG